MVSIVVLATISLAMQIGVLALLIPGYALKTRKSYRKHGITMSIAVILHLATILTVMIPSLISYLSSPGMLNFADPIVIISLFHASLGAVAASFGVWLAGSWHMQHNLTRCFANKRMMAPTLVVWITAISIGIYMYLTLYYTIIIG